MKGFFRKLERFFVNLMVIILIVLISLQVLMKNDETYQKIKNIEFAIKNLFNLEQSVEVTNQIEQYTGFVTIDLLQDLSLPQVWVIKNGQRVKNFQNGIVEIRVQEGDLILIDARNFPQALWFEITYLSPSIYNWQEGEQFRINQEIKRLGIVKTYDKL